MRSGIVALFLFLAMSSCVPSGSVVGSGNHLSIEEGAVFGGRGSNPGLLLEPVGCDMDYKGNIFVADAGNNRIQVFTADGMLLDELGGVGSGQGAMNWPTDVFCDQSFYVYVVDWGNKRVLKFKERFDFTSYFLSTIATGEQLEEPEKIAVSDAGDLFVTDLSSESIVSFDAFGEFETYIGEFGSSPSDLAVRHGRLHFLDRVSRTVIIYDLFGAELRRFPVGEMGDPVSVDVDENGNVFVADRSGGRVVVFGADGAVLSVIDSWRNRKLVSPSSLCVGNGKMVVTDSVQSLVYVFEITVK